MLVKLGEANLAWLAADRAMTAATGDPHRTGLAAISLAQALRALRRGRLAMTAALTAVHQLDRTPARVFLPDEPALTGTLLIEAALAAAACGDDTAAGELTERAAHLATAHGEHRHHDNDGTGFGPTAVELARALTAMRLGDHHRAAHLIDITRAHLDLGDPHTAGRALVTAPAETRTRPAARTALTAVLRAGPTAADVARLAATVGLTRQ
ncbi:hypothetical protein [Micromonospora sp. NPDC001898]|uniref:hypothetical protein n=1 Tax=Micromonospora sp. NPDC001898 TaxID=3364221 RepID=UPI00368A39E2